MREGAFRNPTTVFFGASQFTPYVAEVAAFGPRFLMMSGSSSRLAGDVAQRVVGALESFGHHVVEERDICPGIDSKKIESIVALGRNERINSVLAVGGGTVIDAAKAVSLGLRDPSSLLALFRREAVPVAVAPLCVVLTLPGTGSESSQAAVFVDHESGRKLDLGTPLIQPRVAFIDPELSLSAPVARRAAGVVDAMSHVLERYFTRTQGVEVSTALCESVLRSLVDCGLRLITDSSDRSNAANLAWCAKLAHDDTLGFGRQQDWATHRISHAVESIVQRQFVHGELLAALFPAWLDFVSYRESSWLDRLAASGIFEGIGDVLSANPDEGTSRHPFIRDLRRFYRFLGMPTQLDITRDEMHSLARAIATEAVSGMRSGTLGNYVRLSVSDIEQILIAACGRQRD